MSNVVYVCAEHASKPDLSLALKPPGWFMGKLVKSGFTAPDAHVEHMWVKVTGFADGALIGKLDNDPAMPMGLSYGDTVQVAMDQIEAVLDD